MTSKRFIAMFFTTLACAGAVVIPANLWLDLYGLFANRGPGSHSIYGEERTAKYLHSIRYIPENFDGVLFGSSVSDNIDTRKIAGYYVYNGSINGGNMSDVKPLAVNIFKRHRMRLTVVCAHRYLTNDHALKTDLMTPRQYWSALASPQLITAYLSREAVRRGFTSTSYDGYGSFHYGSSADVRSVQKSMEKAVRDIRRGVAAVGNYNIDSVALADLEEVLQNARAHSDRLIVFFPPTPEPVMAERSTQVAEYAKAIGKLLHPSDVVVDFNTPEYTSLRSNLANFIDAVHMSKAGSDFVVAELAKRAASPANIAVAAR